MDKKQGTIIIGPMNLFEGAVFEDKYTLASIKEKCQRLLIGDSMTYTLDVTRMNPFPWSLFLKVLESPFLIGEVQFFGASQSFYPETIRSRCILIYGEPVKLPDYIKEHMLENIAVILEGLREMNPDDSLETLVEIAKTHDTILDFLTVLDSAKKTDYPIIYTYAQAMTYNHFRMFKSWYYRDYSMSDKEANLCGFLRSLVGISQNFSGHMGDNWISFYFLNLFLCKVFNQ